jgi:hypothetical protein
LTSSENGRDVGPPPQGQDLLRFKPPGEGGGQGLTATDVITHKTLAEALQFLAASNEQREQLKKERAKKFEEAYARTQKMLQAKKKKAKAQRKTVVK